MVKAYRFWNPKKLIKKKYAEIFKSKSPFYFHLIVYNAGKWSVVCVA